MINSFSFLLSLFSVFAIKRLLFSSTDGAFSCIGIEYQMICLVLKMSFDEIDRLIMHSLVLEEF